MDPKVFRETVNAMATKILTDYVSAAELRTAAGACAGALAASRAAARDPKDFDAVLETPEGKASMVRAIVQITQTRLYPGGISPLAYLIPQRPRANAPVEIRYSLSHRGCTALAMREGFVLISVPVHVEDTVTIDFGEVTQHEPNGPQPATLEELAGCYVTIRHEGKLIARPWLGKTDILRRRDRSRTSNAGTWVTDPVPMAQKTTIHYCVARGILPLESAVAREAIGHDEEVVVFDEPAKARRASPRRIESGIIEADEQEAAEMTGGREREKARVSNQPAEDEEERP